MSDELTDIEHLRTSMQWQIDALRSRITALEDVVEAARVRMAVYSHPNSGLIPNDESQALIDALARLDTTPSEEA